MLCIGYPKSGNTWFCFLCSYVFNVIYEDLDAVPGIEPKEVYFRELTKVSKGHSVHRKKVGYNIFKTHKSKNLTSTEEKTVVLLIRDPRDICKSKFYFDFFYLEEELRSKGLNVRTIIKRIRLLLLKSFYTRCKKSYYKKIIRNWVRYHSQIDKIYDDYVIVRYEQLKADPIQTIHDLSERLQHNIDKKIIQEAVDLFSFEKMKLAENDRKVTFFRKGASCTWNTDDFGQELRSYFLRQMDKVPRLTSYK